MSEEARVLAERHGRTWGEHTHFSVSAWMGEVENGDTRSGYWDWVLGQIETEQWETEGTV